MRTTTTLSTPSRPKRSAYLTATALGVALLTACTAASGDVEGTSPSNAAAVQVNTSDCSAVYGTPAQSSKNLVILVDRTASNVPFEMPKALSEEITELSRAGGSLSIVGVGGYQEGPVMILKNAGTSSAGARDAPSVERIAAALPACVESSLEYQPKNSGSDLYPAAKATAELVNAETSLWWLTDGGFNVGQISLQYNGLLRISAERAAQYVARNTPLDLKGVRLQVSGLANSVWPYAPQHREWLLALTRGLCKGWNASGCESIALEPARVSVRPDADKLPPDNSLPFPLITVQRISGGAAPRCRHTIPGSMLFAGDSAALSPQSRSTIQYLVGIMRKSPGTTAVVVGHTASDPSRSGFMKTLSLARAEAVAKAMTAGGVARSRLSTEGVGDTQPLAEDIDHATGRQIAEVANRERRVAVTITGVDC